MRFAALTSQYSPISKLLLPSKLDSHGEGDNNDGRDKDADATGCALPQPGITEYRKSHDPQEESWCTHRGR